MIDYDQIERLRASIRGQAPLPSPSPSIIDRFREISYLEVPGLNPLHEERRLIPHDGRSYIVPITDVHLGHKASLRSKMEAYLQFILETPGVYGLGLGDLAENATKTSVGMGLYEETYHLEQQMEIILELLKPLTRAGKLLGLHRGNHEYRTAVTVGIDPIKVIARELEVPYLGEAAYHTWQVGTQTYTCYSVHGRSGSRTPAGKLNALLRLRDVADADLYLMGHMHDRIMYEDAPYRASPQGPLPRSRTYVLAGSLLSYFQTYAEMNVMSPVRQAWVLIELRADQHAIHVTL